MNFCQTKKLHSPRKDDSLISSDGNVPNGKNKTIGPRANQASLQPRSEKTIDVGLCTSVSDVCNAIITD